MFVGGGGWVQSGVRSAGDDSRWSRQLGPNCRVGGEGAEAGNRALARQLKSSHRTRALCKLCVRALVQELCALLQYLHHLDQKVTRCPLPLATNKNETTANVKRFSTRAVIVYRFVINATDTFSADCCIISSRHVNPEEKEGKHFRNSRECRCRAEGGSHTSALVPNV